MKKILVLSICMLCIFTFSVSVFAEPSAVPEEGLVVYFSFDNDSGTTVKDLSPSNKEATSKSVTYADGKVGKAAVFNGVDSTIEFTNSEALTDISVSLWAKVEKLETDGHQLFAGKLWKNGSLHLAYNKAGFISISFYDWKNTKPTEWGTEAARYYMKNVSDFDQKWLHIAFTYDSAAKHRALYLNGIKVYESDSTTAIQDVFKGDYELGCYSADTAQNGRHFKGLMDEFRVYNRVLSQVEITALAAQGGGPEMEIPLKSTSEPTATPTKAPTPSPTATKTAPTATTQTAQVTPAATKAPEDKNSSSWIVWAIIGAVVGAGGAFLIVKRKKA